MFKKAALSFLLLSGGVNAVNIRERSIAKHAFIKKLRAAHKAKGLPSRKMNWNKLTENSVHKPGLRSQSGSGPSNDSKQKSSPPKAAAQEKQQDRDLSWWNSEPDDPDAQANSNHWWNWWSTQAENLEKDMNETNNNDGSWWSWRWNSSRDDDDMWVRQGENVTYVMEGLKDFSIKYAGCSSLTSFSPSDDENGDGTASPFVNSNYVSYRLCPTETCHDDAWSGCKQVYGEYMMDMETFLAAQQSYVEEEFEYYCNYCTACMYFDKWYSGWNYTTYDENVHGCDLYDECVDYDQICDEEYHQQQEKELGYDYEDFLECTEVEIDLSYYDGYVANDDRAAGLDDVTAGYGYDMDGEYQIPTAYIGPHCDGGEIGIGLFSDEYCTMYVGNKFDIFNVTGFENEVNVISDVYVPNGCHNCAGDNIRNSKWYIPENDQQMQQYEQYAQQKENGNVQYEDEEMETYSEVCYKMYSNSAKCHSHFTEDTFKLELSDSEMLSEESTCDFIDDVIKGHIDEEGFVWSHQQRVNPITGFFQLWADDTGIETDVTGLQVAGLTLGATATAAMAFVAYQFKMRVDNLENPLKETLVNGKQLA